MSNVNNKISAAFKRILKPIIKRLLVNGVGFGQISEWMKEICVISAHEVLIDEGKSVSASSISVMTGLNRKEVAKWKGGKAGDELTEMSVSSNRAMRVVTAWLREEHYSYLEPQQQNTNQSTNQKLNSQASLSVTTNTQHTTPLRAPAIIPLQGEGVSFAALCKQFSGDMPYRAVLDELQRLKMVELVDDAGEKNVKLLKKTFVPSNDLAEIFRILGVAGVDLFSTIAHNMENHGRDSRLQLSVAYDDMPEDVIREFKAYSEKQALALVKSLDVWLAEKHASAVSSEQESSEKESSEPSQAPKSKAGKSQRVGMGFYFLNND